MDKILRTWTFWIRTEHRQELHDHLEAGRLQEMRAAQLILTSVLLASFVPSPLIIAGIPLG
ncbi:MAG: hypothetical protein EOP80_02710 [Variovorax sp.]|nr:MAG: hypothetical protein EOP80_02710 [Variovorax sp.]